MPLQNMKASTKDVIKDHSVYIPPKMNRVIQALRSIGYQMPQAIADLIDNSIDAQATKIVVRFLLKASGGLDLSIWDNGIGMSKLILKEAMRIGSDTEKDELQLGKFGMGLKLASLSQAPKFDVISHEIGGPLYGLRATIESLSENMVDELHEDYCIRLITRSACGENYPSGTAVVLSDLDCLNLNEELTEKTVQRLASKLRAHLGMIYHRLLLSKRITILISTSRDTAESPYPPEEIQPLNPFGYSHPGLKDYPKDFHIPVGKTTVKTKVHIWPPKSKSHEYKLPGGANSRQGLYIFRNDRLLQAGGWNGIRENEPHLSLCRIELDIPALLDDAVHLDIKKASVYLPEGFDNKLSCALASDGTKFDAALSSARSVYRNNPSKPVSPNFILPYGAVIPTLRKILKKHKKIKLSESEHIELKWKKLSNNEMFHIDRENGNILLSSSLKKALAEIPAVEILPILLYYILEEHLVSQRQSEKANRELELIQDLLRAFIKQE